MSMSEVDEREITEVAKGAPRVLRGASNKTAGGDARKVVEAMALLERRKRGGGRSGGET
ncbi:hypothetical protein [Streptomyces sp. CB03238]|uniref:hypothetical protein n=1 Tax=Streptomyces sp. CB03238 TaxID=1907777 RepID=UPI0015C43606|nr:hypothetical protein [Streptomyces sp. CB03238]